MGAAIAECQRFPLAMDSSSARSHVFSSTSYIALYCCRLPFSIYVRVYRRKKENASKKPFSPPRDDDPMPPSWSHMHTSSPLKTHYCGFCSD